MPSKSCQIRHRPFRDGDFDAVTDLCVRAWYGGVEGIYDRIVFGRVMTVGALRRSGVARVAVTDERVVGACFGGIYPNERLVVNEEWDQRFKDTMAVARKRAKLGGIRIEERLFSKLRMYTVADVFISRGYATAQSEFNLLVVHPQFAGRGIGKRLFDDTLDIFARAGAQGCFAVVDDDFDLNFLKAQGLGIIEMRHGASGDSGKRTVSLLARRL